jgi:hypothetical protein
VTKECNHLVLAHLSETNNTARIAMACMRSALAGSRFKGTLDPGEAGRRGRTVHTGKSARRKAASIRVVLTRSSERMVPRGAMKKTAHARFAIKSWDEKPYSEGAGLPKLTRASVVKTLSGDIEGVSQVEYLMMYRADGTATFVGLERVTARIGERSGSFVMQRAGGFEGGLAKESYAVVAGSATGDLRGLRGEGATSVGHGMEHPFELTYELE